MSNKNTISYRNVGDYLIPNFVLTPEGANIRLGKWGMIYKDYLENNKKVFFNILLMQGKLYQHCAEIEKQAVEMFELLVEQMKVAEGVTEQLKEENQIEWICRTQNIVAKAREVVLHDIVHLKIV